MMYKRSRDKKWSSGGFIDTSLGRVRDISSRTFRLERVIPTEAPGQSGDIAAGEEGGTSVHRAGWAGGAKLKGGRSEIWGSYVQWIIRVRGR